MPNRFIKESIRTSDTLAAVSPEAERLFWRLVVSVDDYGRFDARPNIIIGQSLSSFLGNVTSIQVQLWLSELEQAKLLQMYQVESRPYLLLTKWSKHQRTRAKDSKFPSPDDVSSHPLTYDSKRGQAQTNVVSNVFVNEFVNENEIKHSKPESDLSSTETGGAQSKVTGKGKSAPAEKPEYTEEFESFWTVYPRRKEKKSAFKAWSARVASGVEPKTLIKAAEAYAKECRDTKREEKYIKLPATFVGPSLPYEDYLYAEDKQIEPLHRKNDPNAEEMEWRRQMFGDGP